MSLAHTVRVEMMDCAQPLALFYWLQYRFPKRLKRETLQRAREAERAKRSRTRRKRYRRSTYWLFRLDSLIGCCIRSSWQTVSNVQLSSLFHSTLATCIPDTRYTTTESSESTPKVCQSGPIRIETTSQSGLTQTGSKSIRLEPV